MKRNVRIAAAVALSLPAIFGAPVSAATGGGPDAPAASGPIHSALTADDPVHALIAEAALELERRTGITDPSAPSQ